MVACESLAVLTFALQGFLQLSHLTRIGRLHRLIPAFYALCVQHVEEPGWLVQPVSRQDGKVASLNATFEHMFGRVEVATSEVDLEPRSKLSGPRGCQKVRE
jgi:hypothetical protein